MSGVRKSSETITEIGTVQVTFMDVVVRRETSNDRAEKPAELTDASARIATVMAPCEASWTSSMMNSSLAEMSVAPAGSRRTSRSSLTLAMSASGDKLIEVSNPLPNMDC